MDKIFYCGNLQKDFENFDVLQFTLKKGGVVVDNLEDLTAQLVWKLTFVDSRISEIYSLIKQYGKDDPKVKPNLQRVLNSFDEMLMNAGKVISRPEVSPLTASYLLRTIINFNCLKDDYKDLLNDKSSQKKLKCIEKKVGRIADVIEASEIIKVEITVMPKQGRAIPPEYSLN